MGSVCHFTVLERAPGAAEYVRDNHLTVSVNPETGYGALMWCVSDRVAAERGGVFGRVWLSDNPIPPDADPEVVADPGDGMLFDPGSTLPLSSVRAALAEFCRVRSGERPQGIAWVPGDLRGRRSDRRHERPVTAAGDYSSPWV
ncbi:hypothetical protein J2S44_000904 [Catenuloplanes niger]|uniref:Immunity protein Imm1 n=1 Tax=Catenuloplanes niger TaxID=587534 RepID=A0AAE4CTF1_9ACTN|nr:hypothetical protein [Catenuloplanes niger]